MMLLSAPKLVLFGTLVFTVPSAVVTATESPTFGPTVDESFDDPTDFPTDAPTTPFGATVPVPTPTPIPTECYEDKDSHIYSDPHFRTWRDLRYDFQWECDMVHITNNLLDLHIRTETRGRWSAVIQTALRFNTDVLRIFADGTIEINGVNAGASPFIFDGYSVDFTGTGFYKNVYVRLSSGQYIRFDTRGTYGGINMYIDANGSDFCDSNGMAGNWLTDGFIGRNGNTVSVRSGPNKVEYGIEWEVGAGDPILLEGPAPHNCADPVRRRLEPTRRELQDAETICQGLITNPLDLDNCVFDVIQEDEAFVREVGPYEEVFEVRAKCVPREEDSESQNTNVPTCAELGGQCVLSCDPNVSNCFAGLNLCVENFETVAVGTRQRNLVGEGCSCALPKDLTDDFTFPPTDVPTIEPTFSPTDVPTTDEPTLSPTDAPTPGRDCENSSAPLQFLNGDITTCEEVASLSRKKRREQCQKPVVKNNCPAVCFPKDCCFNNPNEFTLRGGKKKSCSELKQGAPFCKRKQVKENCAAKCLSQCFVEPADDD